MNICLQENEKNFKKFTLSIIGSINNLSICLLNKKKIIKVKHYQLISLEENEDDFFKNLIDFFKNLEIFLSDISYIFVGYGPGSFTSLRKSISFVQALRFSIINQFASKKLFVLGINNLSVLPYHYGEKINDKIKYVLSVIDTQCNDYFVQIFSIKNNKPNISVLPISEIKIIKLSEIDDYIKFFSIDKKNLTILGLPTNNLIKIKNISNNDFYENFIFHPSEYIGKIGYEIMKIRRKESINKHNFFNENLEPLYVRSPKIN